LILTSSEEDLLPLIEIVQGSSQFSQMCYLLHTHERMEMQNNLLDENVQNLIDSPQLSYMLNVEKVGNSVSKATDNSPQKGTQCV